MTTNWWVDLLRDVMFLPEPASTFADPVDALHLTIFGATVLGTVAVFAFTAYCLVRFHHRRPGNLTYPRGAPAWLEISFIAGLLSLFIAAWVVGFRLYVEIRTPPPGALDVYVTAKQWMWKFAYPDGKSSAGVLVVPVDRPVKLIMTSRDVIHSFFVPAFRTKHDVIPGQYSIAWFQATRPGTYQALCTEFCGFDHSRMRAQVVVLSSRQWAEWDQRTGDLKGAVHEETVPGFEAATDLAARGRVVAARKGCLGCHSVDGSPHIGPTWVGLFGSRVPLQDGTIVVADERYLTESMMDPRAKVVAGFEPVMPTYAGQLTAAETASLVEYIRVLADGPDHDPGEEPPPPAHEPLLERTEGFREEGVRQLDLGEGVEREEEP